MIHQHIIYREKGRFAGWPANYGMWNWGNEIVVVFTEGTFKASKISHARDKSKPFRTLQARSMDGGVTWDVSEFPGKTPDNLPISADEHVKPELSLRNYLSAHPDAIPPVSDSINFTHPDFALMCGRTGLGPGTQSFFFYSYDRCRTWNGPFKLPMFEQTAIAARTSYQVESADSCILFLTANKSNGNEGRVFCTRTSDGGKTFDFVSFIGEEPPEKAFGIMPSHLLLENRRYLCAIRYRSEKSDQPDNSWIDLYSSDDDGKNWNYMNRPVTFHDPGNSNPPSLVQLSDGRIVLVYGNRDEPTSVCARISSDRGQSWSESIMLRQTRGSKDMGYTRAVVLPDDTIVTAYYLNDQADGDGERFIEATRWKLD